MAEASDDNWETVRLAIDRDFIDRADDPMDVIEPLWWSVMLDGDWRASLDGFSRPQSLVWAFEWYLAETGNGGHDQFFLNSAGNAWQLVREALQEMGFTSALEIFDESIGRMGGAPSVIRDERNDQLEQLEPDFSDLDDRLFEIDEFADSNAKVMSYIRERAGDFFFEGDIRRMKPLKLFPT